MAIVFYPHAIPMWWRFVPVAGQELQLLASLQGGALRFLQPLILGCATIAATALVVIATANSLQRDDVVYGD